MRATTITALLILLLLGCEGNITTPPPQATPFGTSGVYVRFTTPAHIEALRTEDLATFQRLFGEASEANLMMVVQADQAEDWQSAEQAVQAMLESKADHPIISMIQQAGAHKMLSHILATGDLSLEAEKEALGKYTTLLLDHHNLNVELLEQSFHHLRGHWSDEKLAHALDQVIADFDADQAKQAATPAAKQGTSTIEAQIPQVVASRDRNREAIARLSTLRKQL